MTTIKDDFAPTQETKKKSWKRVALNGAKAVILALVCFWFFKTLYASWDGVAQYDWNLQWSWLVASGAFYLAGYFFAAIFWLMTLRELGQKATPLEAFAAYYNSQLGKYVPGKALVVIIRTSMLAATKGNRASVLATSVFYETLTMMGTGAFLGAVIILLTLRDNRLFSLLVFAVALGALIPLLPPVFTRIVRLLRIGKGDPEAARALELFRYRRFFQGIALMTALWVMFGLSLWAALRGLGVQTDPIMNSAPHYVAVTALATSLGFVMLISPGGLGVRELILSTLLVPHLATLMAAPANAAFTVDASALATIVSLLQRIVSIVVEVGASVALVAVLKIARSRRLDDARDN